MGIEPKIESWGVASGFGGGVYRDSLPGQGAIEGDKGETGHSAGVRGLRLRSGDCYRLERGRRLGGTDWNRVRSALVDSLGGGGFGEELQLVGPDLEGVTGHEGDGLGHSDALVAGSDGRSGIVEDVLVALADDRRVKGGHVVIAEEGDVSALIATEVGLGAIDWPLLPFVPTKNQAYPGLPGGLFEPSGEESNTESDKGEHDGASGVADFVRLPGGGIGVLGYCDDLTNWVEEEPGDSAADESAKRSSHDDAGFELGEPDSGSQPGAENCECDCAGDNGESRRRPAGAEDCGRDSTADLVAEESADRSEDCAESEAEENIAGAAFHVALVESGGETNAEHRHDEHPVFGDLPF